MVLCLIKNNIIDSIDFIKNLFCVIIHIFCFSQLFWKILEIFTFDPQNTIWIFDTICYQRSPFVLKIYAFFYTKQNTHTVVILIHSLKLRSKSKRIILIQLQEIYRMNIKYKFTTDFPKSFLVVRATNFKCYLYLYLYAFNI